MSLAAEDDGVLRLRFDFVAAKKFTCSRRGCRRPGRGAAADEAAEIDGMKNRRTSFAGSTASRIRLASTGGGSGSWDKNADRRRCRDSGLRTTGEEIEGGHVAGGVRSALERPSCWQSGESCFDVELRGGIFSDEDRREAWAKRRPR